MIQGTALGTVAEDCVASIVASYGNDPERLLDIARGVQSKLGYLSEDTIGQIASELGMRRAAVRDAVSFYSFLSRNPQGKTVIHICTAVPERMRGAESLIEAFENALGIKLGETTPCGRFTLAETACIGMSDQGPSALINGKPVVNLRPNDVAGLLGQLRDGIPVAALPQAQIADNIQQRGEVLFSPRTIGDGLRRALSMEPDAVIAELTASGLRGRGGAGFPTGMKWRFCRRAAGEKHFIICNADEGEPGTFKDRVILSVCPGLLFEGMTIAAYAIDSEEGMLYLRAEYAYLLPLLEAELERQRKVGLLGKEILGKPGFNFDIRIQLGAGAYVCGEESALIESLEGKRGAPRSRPPFPVKKGRWEQPTSVNNVETLCCAARIAEKGAAWFKGMGTKDSTGTKLLSISGDCESPGIYEVEYGLTLREMLELAGAETASAIQVGGPSGQCIGPEGFERKIAFEDLPTGGSMIIFGKDRDILAEMTAFTRFFADESCGWCSPCRAGTTLLVKMMEKILSGRAASGDLDRLETLAQTVKTMSRCGLGQTAANPILTTLQNFRKLYEARLLPGEYAPILDLQSAKRECIRVAGRTDEEGH